MFRGCHVIIWGILCCVWAMVAKAELDEYIISDMDQRCAIRYLTIRPKKNWTIQTDAANCPDGFITGSANVRLYDPTHHLSETLTGFFLNGYWMDQLWAPGALQDRSNPQENVQALTFHLGEDAEHHLNFLAQARAVRLENRSYGPFDACPDVRILVVAAQRSIFQDLSIQHIIAQQGLMYAKSLCPNLSVAAIFGTDKMNARAPDIVFQMQVDPETLAEEVIPVSYDYQFSDINHPVELRHQGGQVLLSIAGQSEDTNQDDVLLDAKVPLNLTTLAQVDVLSRLQNQSVEGRFVVHIQSVDLDGTGYVDLPDTVVLKYYPNLKTGWAIVQGKYFHHEMMIQKITYCQKEWCLDVA